MIKAFLNSLLKAPFFRPSVSVSSAVGKSRLLHTLGSDRAGDSRGARTIVPKPKVPEKRKERKAPYTSRRIKRNQTRKRL